MESTARINSVESYGGKLTDVDRYTSGRTAPIDEESYIQCDYLTSTGYKDISKDDYILTGIILEHQRADFVVTIADGADHDNDGDNPNTLADNAALSIRVTLTDANGGISIATYFAWNAGKDADGKTTFRVILPAKYKIDDATLYPEGHTNNANDVRKKITLTYSGNGDYATNGLAAGSRYTASLTYYDYETLTATFTLGAWTAEEHQGEIGTGDAINYFFTPAVTDANGNAIPASFTVNTGKGLAEVSQIINGVLAPVDKDGNSHDVGYYYSNANITLAASIDMTNVSGFQPIGNISSSYKGTFDGNGHTITGLSYSDASKNGVGLIGRLSGGSVKNVNLDRPAFSGEQNIGGIVGSNFDGTITNCTVSSGTINGNYYVGGIVGSINGGSLTTGCTVSGVHIYGTQNIGGIVGNINGGTITGCTAYGADIGGDNAVTVGGIVGYNNSDTAIVGDANDADKKNTVDGCKVKGMYYTGILVGDNEYPANAIITTDTNILKGENTVNGKEIDNSTGAEKANTGA